MKIRYGFVSNSSTSSFVIYGIEADVDELIEKAGGDIPKEFTVKGCRHDFDRKQFSYCPECGCLAWETHPVDNYEILEKVCKKLGVNHCNPGDYTDNVYIGFSPDCMTGKDIMQKIVETDKKIEDLFGKDKEARLHSGTYYC